MERAPVLISFRWFFHDQRRISACYFHDQRRISAWLWASLTHTAKEQSFSWLIVWLTSILLPLSWLWCQTTTPFLP